MTAWQDKAHRLISEMARNAQEKANRLPGGRLRKRHVPYSLPEDAHRLVRFLGTNDEKGAKALFQELAFRRPE
jgi:hypothetical protein